MLNYQSTSFHDALYVRDLFGLKRAPEFDDWLLRAGLADADFRLAGNARAAARFCLAADRLSAPGGRRRACPCNHPAVCGLETAATILRNFWPSLRDACLNWREVTAQRKFDES